ncbi:hypothetical protein BVRB_5g104760 [Beta vulgaris subsp. vulgaris]|nr:hypothetical protein BVRB_5g104760 [Beta vulgaris subsp. vulgaris]
MKFVVVESYSFLYVCVLGALDKFMNYLVVEKKTLDTLWIIVLGADE